MGNKQFGLKTSTEALAAKTAIMQAAIALGAALRAIRHEDCRDIEMAHAMDIIAESSTGDGHSALANCALDIRLQAEKNMADAEELPQCEADWHKDQAQWREALRIGAL